MPFWAEYIFLGRDDVSGLESPFGLEFPFGPQMTFRAANTLLGHDCPFGLRMSYQAKNALSGRKQRSATAGIAHDNQPRHASWILFSLPPRVRWV